MAYEPPDLGVFSVGAKRGPRAQPRVYVGGPVIRYLDLGLGDHVAILPGVYGENFVLATPDYATVLVDAGMEVAATQKVSKGNQAGSYYRSRLTGTATRVLGVEGGMYIRFHYGERGKYVLGDVLGHHETHPGDPNSG